MNIFKPNGSLNIATAPSDLEEEEGYSGEMSRCKNLVLERQGVAVTRHGSRRTTENQLVDSSNFIIEQAGNRYVFAGGRIHRDEVSIATDLTDSQWSAIKYNAFNDTTQRIFALNGTDRKKISGTTVREWGLEPPGSVATLTTGGTTGLTGSYRVRYTYAVKSGATVITESNPSAASASQSLSNQSLSVTFAASSDPQVTHIRIYRTLASGSIYLHDQDVAAGSTSVDTNTADTSLGAELQTTHNRPPLGSIVFGPMYNGVCFIAKDNLLYWCSAKQPEYWPTNNFIEVGPPQFPITAIISYDAQVYCLTKNQIWWIQGTSGSAFNPVPLESLAGASHIFGAESVKGVGIYHIGADGLYLYSGGRDKKVSQDFYEPIFPDAGGNDGVLTNGVQPVPSSPLTLWIKKFQNRIYFHYSNGNILVNDLDKNRTWYYKYDLRLTSPAIDQTNDRFLVGDSGNYIRQIEDPTVETDIGGAISWEIQSKDYTLQTRAHFPRYVKYDVDTTNATGVVGSVVLDDVVHQQHPLSLPRSVVRRLVKTGNGNRMALRVTGSGKVLIYAIEAE